LVALDYIAFRATASSGIVELPPPQSTQSDLRQADVNSRLHKRVSGCTNRLFAWTAMLNRSLHHYNWHRPHHGIGKPAPIIRLAQLETTSWRFTASRQ
jgi:hypothetical protein